MSSNIYLVGIHHKDIDGVTRMNSFLDKIKPKIIAIEWDNIRDATIDSSDYPSLDEIISQSKRDCEELENYLRENRKELDNVQKAYTLLGLNLNPKQIALDRITTYLTEKLIPEYFIRVSKQYALQHADIELNYIDVPRKNISDIRETYETDFVEGIQPLIADLDSSELESILNTLNAGFDNWLEFFRKTIAAGYDKEKANEIFAMVREDIQENGGDAYSRAAFDPEREKYMGRKIRELALKNQGSLVAFVGLGHLLRLNKEINDLNPRALTLEECSSFN